MQGILKFRLLLYLLDLPSSGTSENQRTGIENTWRFEVNRNQAQAMLVACFWKMTGCNLSLNLCSFSIIQFERYWPSQRGLGPSPANTYAAIQQQITPWTQCDCQSAINSSINVWRIRSLGNRVNRCCGLNFILSGLLFVSWIIVQFTLIADRLWPIL